MRLPNLVIVGVGKGGTTSLFWYLSQHPDVCASHEKEIRYFAALTEGGVDLPPIEAYAKPFEHCRDERYAMEASPQYFHGGARVAHAMTDVLGTPKVVVSLRDPVDRLWSQFRFIKTRFGPVPDEMTFEEYADRNERVWRDGLPLTPETTPYWHLSGGVYANHIAPWFDAFGDDFRVMFFEHLTARPAATIEGLARWLNIDTAPIASFSFSVENRTVPVRSAALQRIALLANREDVLGRRRRLKAPLRRVYYALNRRRSTDAMPPAVEAHLRELLAPHNERLADQLTARGYVDLPSWLRSPAPAAQ
jgi:hypothetical protein